MQVTILDSSSTLLQLHVSSLEFKKKVFVVMQVSCFVFDGKVHTKRFVERVFVVIIIIVLRQRTKNNKELSKQNTIAFLAMHPGTTRQKERRIDR